MLFEVPGLEIIAGDCTSLQQTTVCWGCYRILGLVHGYSRTMFEVFELEPADGDACVCLFLEGVVRGRCS
jgi:hypothetical protein